MKLFSLKKIKPNPSNPRILRDDQYKKLLASIKRDPEFLSKRPIVHAEGVILGGNQRYHAILEATKDPEFRAKIGTKKEGEVPEGWVLDASEFSEEQRRRFVIVDNAPDGMSGEWDWDVLANEWGDIDLGDLGLQTIESLDRDGDYRAGTSPWERMDGDAQEGVLLTFGSITTRIDKEVYEVFYSIIPDDSVNQFITDMIRHACKCS